MKTIPLEPVFNNGRFLEQNPTFQLYIIKAIYLLAKDRKLALPLPSNLRAYFHCSNPSYWRFKEVFKDILLELIPEIHRAKNTQRKLVDKAIAQNIVNAASRRLQRNSNDTFSDKNDMHLEITPLQIPREKWNKGKVDHVAIAKAKQSKDENTDDILFTDSVK